jgi:DNA modification methylase
MDTGTGVETIAGVLEGRLDYGLLLGDSLEVLKSFPDNSIDAVVCDPPYAINFLGKEFDDFRNPKGWENNVGFSEPGFGSRETPWPSYGGISGANPTCETCGGRARGSNRCECETPDWRVKGEPVEGSRNRVQNLEPMRNFQRWVQIWAKEALRVVKPGGHLLAFGATRAYHRLACGIEESGWEIRDTIAWMYGCLTPDHEVLLENGTWVPGLSVKPGDRILCLDPHGEKESFEVVEETYLYSHRGYMYNHVGELVDLVVTPNHRCLVLGDLSSKPTLVEANRTGESFWGLSPLVEGSVPSGVVASLVGSTVSSYDGLVWCVRVRTGVFCVRRNGKVSWTGNSGFPKSMNVGKAIDASHENAPATPEAKEWDGWGTTLKPAYEPCVVARKPMGTTIAENVLKWGTGAINIEACRVGNADTRGGGKVLGWFSNGCVNEGYTTGSANGRFPANVLLSHHEDCVYKGVVKVKTSGDPRRKDGTLGGADGRYDGGYRPGVESTHKGFGGDDGKESVDAYECHCDCPVRILDVQSGISKSTGGRINKISSVGQVIYGQYGKGTNKAIKGDPGFGDVGGASRFFYTSKASQKERSCEGAVKNDHPTVKNKDIMAYLCRLVTKPGGIVLDPFMGSGTTGMSALREGFRFIGIEMDPHYYDIARQRVGIEAGDRNVKPMEETIPTTVVVLTQKAVESLEDLFGI